VLRLLAFLLVAGLAAPAPPRPQTVFVMRHLNTPAGASDPDLLPEGQRRAALLARWFRRGERPAAIYVTDYRRTRQSAAPLAAALHLTPIVYNPADTPALIARVRAEHGNVLIIGHSNTVPDIIAALGGARPEPLGHDDFGDIWRVNADGATARLNIDAPPRQ
jgi:broad specificity phosphatase PhoE